MRLKRFMFLGLALFGLVLNSIFLFKLSINQFEPNELMSNLTLNKSFSILENIKRNLHLNDLISNNFLVPSSIKKQKINEFNYEYILKPNESFCQTQNKNGLLLIAFVPISPQNFNQRHVIRSTWANHQLIKNFRVVFMIGASSQREINDAIRNESITNGDIVQNNFTDSYFNLTTKTIMGFRWVSTYCSNAKYTLKVDDDVVVNINRLLKFLDRISTKQSYQMNTIFGRFFENGAPVVRVNTSKFYLSKNEHPEDFFVPYCDGPSYMLTTDLTKKMYDLAFYTPQFKFEDVFTGVIKNY